MSPRRSLWPAILGVLGASGAALILTACGLVSIDPPGAQLAFPGCLVAMLVAAAGFTRQGRRSWAVVAVVFVVVLLLLSVMPWYVAHWYPPEGQYHRHTIWELGHVH